MDGSLLVLIVRTVLTTKTDDFQSLNESLLKFWELEAVPSISIMSPNDQTCMRHLKETYTRNAHGRFVLRLPFREKPDLPNSRGIAEACSNRLF